MKKIIGLLLLSVLLFSTCQRDKSSTEENMAVATPPAKVADEKIGNDIATAIQQLTTEPAEELSSQDTTSKKDPGKLLGRWAIKHIIYSTNGKPSDPSPPIMPTIWEFRKDGRFSVLGGNNLDLKYIFTGDKLLVAGFGPKQTYEIVKLTDKDLEVVSKISAGSVLIENTTVLTRETNKAP